MPEIKASPRNRLLGAFADVARNVNDFAAKPFGYDNPPVAMMAGLLGLPAVANTLNELSYGGALGTGSGMTWKPKADTVDAAMTLLPLGATVGKAAIEKAPAAVARLAENAMAPRTLSPQAGALRIGEKPFVYPQEQALLTAQKNAALPVEQGGLGLRPDNTPMERAKALGFDLPQFHETTANKLDGIAANGFNPRNAVAAASDTETPYGVFTKSNGASIGLAKDGEVQLPLMVRPGSVDAFADRNSLVANVGATNPELKSLWRTIGLDEKERANQIDALGEQMTNRLRPTNESGLSNAEIWKQIDELADGNPELSKKAKELLTEEFLSRGVDTVAIFNDAGSMGRKVNTSISLNPANVRSRFAAFDPMRINENDLLGRASPGLLGLIGGGTGLGLLGNQWLTDR